VARGEGRIRWPFSDYRAANTCGPMSTSLAGGSLVFAGDCLSGLACDTPDAGGQGRQRHLPNPKRALSLCSSLTRCTRRRRPHGRQSRFRSPMEITGPR